MCAEPKYDHAVVVAGAGPTGLMLGCELALAGVDVAIVERRPNQELNGSRAGGLHSRTIEILDQRGIADRFLSQGRAAQVAAFSGVPLDISDFPTRHPYGLALRQNRIEAILAGWADELAVPIYRGDELAGAEQDGAGVNIVLAEGGSLRSQYLVGCDGGRSSVRKAAGIEFPGWDATTSCLVAEVETAATPGEEPEWDVVRRDSVGVHGFTKLDDGKTARVVVTEQHLRPSREPSLRELSEALTAVYGTDYGIHSPTSISRFTDMARQAAAYRDRRMLLAGDAAHVHHPAGGQGLNIGVQDAVNLGWKLAQVVHHASPDSLLDSYHSERHPVAARVLRNTMAQMALLRRSDDHTAALSHVLAELLGMDEPRKRFAAMMSGLDIHYDLGEGHPLLGRRMPDVDLDIADGPLRVFALLHDARPVLINFCEPGHFDVAPWAHRVRLVDAKYVGEWNLPVFGAVAAPSATLIRPDGYVAWVGDRLGRGLADALTAWFGPPAATPGLR
jgi:3-(3-hydroxy-phenyl)propionate hydroxylase